MDYQYVWQFIQKQLFRPHSILLAFITLELYILFFLAELIDAVLDSDFMFVFGNGQSQIHDGIELILLISTLPTNEDTSDLALE